MKFGRYLIGLASGLTFGMLFAPKKGKDLRKEILKKGRSDNPVDSLRALGVALKEAGEEILGEFQSIAKSEQVGAAVELSKEKIKAKFSELEESYPELAKMAKDKIDAIVVPMKEKAGKTVKKASQLKKKASSQKKAIEKTVRKTVKSGKRKVAKAANQVKKAADKVSKEMSS